MRWDGIDINKLPVNRNLVHSTLIVFLSAISCDATFAAGLNVYSFNAGLRLGDATLFAPWWRTLQRNRLQQVKFDLCVRNADTCSRHERSLRKLILRGRLLSVEDQLELVNRYINRRDYQDDRVFNDPGSRHRVLSPGPIGGTSEIEGQPDLLAKRRPRSHWSTLYEFLQRGGDCEDYAASKYFLLRMLGLDAESMRIVVAKEDKQRGHHAVLAYRWSEGKVWLLESDNVIKKRSHRGYRYVYALNASGVWDYRPAP